MGKKALDRSEPRGLCGSPLAIRMKKRTRVVYFTGLTRAANHRGADPVYSPIGPSKLARDHVFGCLVDRGDGIQDRGLSGGGYWILQHDGSDLAAKMPELGLSVGDNILLYQDDDDFEVIAALDYKFVDSIGSLGWVAYPDWSTLRRLPTGPDRAASSETGRRVA
jgi:hypothetical protein